MTNKELVKTIREKAGIKDYLLDGYYGQNLSLATAFEIERIFNAYVAGELDDLPRMLYYLIEAIVFDELLKEVPKVLK